MTNNPNYQLAETTAFKIIEQFNISSLPIYLYDITKTYKDLKVRGYTWFMQKNKMTLEETIEFANSESGCCWYHAIRNQHLILYNDTIPNQGHIRWTIAHEFGHYLLKHNEKSKSAIISRNSLTKKEYEQYEKEANCFARTLLAPPLVIVALNARNSYDIENICSISFSAATNICNFLKYGDQIGKNYSLNCAIGKQFYDFVYQKRCVTCHNYFVHPNAKYCPICGKETLFWGNLNSPIYRLFEGVKTVLYSGIEQSEGFKATICPRCQNEEVYPPGDFCKICGANLVNKCAGYWADIEGTFITGCDINLEGNARYCPQCGNPSSYYRDGFLSSWSDAKNKRTTWKVGEF